jgi:hypothetical protein
MNLSYGSKREHLLGGVLIGTTLAVLAAITGAAIAHL